VSPSLPNKQKRGERKHHQGSIQPTAQYSTNCTFHICQGKSSMDPLLCDGLLQFGKVYVKQGNNFNLYKDEMRRHKEEKFVENPSRNKATTQISKMNFDADAQKWIGTNKEENYASEYEEGYNTQLCNPSFTQYGDWIWKWT
jgi:hypothetical protein